MDELDLFINELLLPLKASLKIKESGLKENLYEDLEYFSKNLISCKDFCLGYVTGFLKGRYPNPKENKNDNK